MFGGDRASRSPRRPRVRIRMEWPMQKPSWCGHLGCQFLSRVEDALCVGELSIPKRHGGDENSHRICFNPEGNVEQSLKPGKHVFDLKLNKSDCDAIRFVLDKVDGKKTSWRSKLGGEEQPKG